MEIGQLRYVVQAAKEGSINKAAKSLKVGQSSISKSIQELEKELGCILFMRTSSGIIPTKNGIEFLTYPKLILEQTDSLLSRYQQKATNPSLRLHSLTIYLSESNNIQYIDDAFAHWCHLYGTEHSIINVYVAPKEDILSFFSSSSQKIDFAIFRIKAKDSVYWNRRVYSEKLNLAVLWEFQLYALMHTSHPLSSAKELSYSMLKPYQEVICSSNRDATDGQIAVPNPSMQLSCLKNIAGSYALSCPLSDYYLISESLKTKPISTENVTFPDFAPDLSYQDIIIWSGSLSDSAQLLLENIKQMIAEINL